MPKQSLWLCGKTEAGLKQSKRSFTRMWVQNALDSPQFPDIVQEAFQ